MSENFKTQIKCSICDELINGKNSRFFRSFLKEVNGAYKVENRILFENEHFVVIPSLGPVSKCHLLVLPKKHVCSFSVLDLDLLLEAEDIIKKVSEIVKEKYGGVVAFEHGVLNENMIGSASCDHAHIHIVACSYSLREYLIKDGVILRKIESLSQVRIQKDRGLPYFYYCEDNSGSWIMDDTIKKSQYFRILIAELLGHSEKGIWQKSLGVQDMVGVIFDLKDCLCHMPVCNNIKG